MKNIKLLGNKILVQNEEQEKTTKSGFILPENKNDEKLRTAKVLAVGTGPRNEDGERVEMEVKVGDRVLYEYSSYGTKEVESAGKKYYILREDDVVGILL